MTRAGAMAAIVLAAGALSGCGAGSASGTKILTVYLSLPMHGDRGAEGEAVAHGAQLGLKQAHGEAGGVRVRAVYLDDTGGSAAWDPVSTAANARRAAEDTSTIAFIGDLDDGATRTSLPITNQADILQISPGSTAVDLTRHVSSGLDPALYRPGGEQTFARLVPNADVLEREAARSCGSDPTAPAALSPYRAPSSLGPRAAPFLRAYRARFGPPPAPAAYGYEAMSLVLSAVDRAGGSDADRQSVIDELMSTRDRRSVIGTYSIESTGDTSLEAAGPATAAACRG